MAVYKSKDPFRVKPWCADIYKGSTRVKRYFATQQEANEEHAKLTLSPVSKKGWDKIKVRHLVERYRDEITPTKAGADNETYRLNYIINNHPGKMLCGYSLSDLVEQVQAWQYIRARQKEVTMRTISRERNLLQDIFRVATVEWGYIGLTNPFARLKLKGSKYKRTRRLQDGEYDKLLEGCTKCHGHNRVYVRLAIDIAIDTGMREQEVFNLRWIDIDFDNRIITIRKSKTDDRQEIAGRRIVLPFNTLVDLVCAKATMEYDAAKYGVKYDIPELKQTDRIFPMTQSAVIQAFEKVVVRAKIEDLEYRDLRREANSRWDDLEPPLTLTQRKTLLGQMGASAEINDVYSNSNLKLIREKLDRQISGMTFEDQFRGELERGMSVYEIVKCKYWEEPAPLFKTRKDAKEFADNLFNDDTPPDEEQKQRFAMTTALLAELGKYPPEEQLRNVLDTVNRKVGKSASKTPDNEVKKLKLVPRNPEWNMEEHKEE